MRSRKNFKILPENVDNKLSTNRNKRKIGYAIKMKSYARTRHTTTIHKESRRLSFPPHNHLYLSTSTRFPDNIASTNTRQTHGRQYISATGTAHTWLWALPAAFNQWEAPERWVHTSIHTHKHNAHITQRWQNEQSSDKVKNGIKKKLVYDKITNTGDAQKKKNPTGKEWGNAIVMRNGKKTQTNKRAHTFHWYLPCGRLSKCQKLCWCVIWRILHH